MSDQAQRLAARFAAERKFPALPPRAQPDNWLSGQVFEAGRTVWGAANEAWEGALQKASVKVARELAQWGISIKAKDIQEAFDPLPRKFSMRHTPALTKAFEKFRLDYWAHEKER